jgi:outer membrane protein with beta-barrel domain
MSLRALDRATTEKRPQKSLVGSRGLFISYNSVLNYRFGGGGMNKFSAGLLLLVCLPSVAWGQFFAGALGGFATISADHRALISAASSATSAYGTMNGPAFMIYFGRHFTDYLSGQITFGWNHNDLSLSSVGFDASGESSYEEARNSRQQSVIADLMLYFRSRRSFARPYLSVGTGWTQLESSLVRVEAVTGSPPIPAQEFSSSAPALRVAVGIDLFAKKGWAFRYSFAETIRSNAISQQLAPPALHNLANFQNLFGVTWQF